MRIQTSRGCREATPEEAAALNQIVAEIKRKQALECRALSDVRMPPLAQNIHGRGTYWCVRKGGHDGPHRFPEDGRIAEWGDR